MSSSISSSSKLASSPTASTSSSTTPKPAPPKKYPFYLGGMAASIAACFTHPLDLTKTRMQTASARPNMFSLMLKTLREEGPRGLYVGLTASLLRQMTYSVTRFGAYDKLKEMTMKQNADGKALGPMQMALCASAAGAAGGLAGNPADILLVRMTSDVNRKPADRYNYPNAIGGLVRMTKDEGVGSLFRGLGPNMVRAVLMNASQLATYDVFKNLLLSSGYFDEGTGLHFSASFMAGTVATTVCSPADVIKSRVMNAAGSGEGIIKTLRKDLSKEGVGFLFRGWTPAWMRLSPNTIIVFVVLEKLRLLVDYTRENHTAKPNESNVQIKA